LLVRYRERREQDAHRTAAKMGDGTLNLVPLTSSRRSRCASSQRFSSPKELLGFEIARPLSRTP
jgi:hypothetical protein